MKEYNNMKSSDIISSRNADENESRSEIVYPAYIDSESINIKSIHNKRKESR